MNINWKQIGWRTLQGFILFIINGATFAFIVMNMINLDIVIEGKSFELSYWEALSNKTLYNLVELLGDKNIVLNNLPDYHWYNTMLVYLFMILGILCSYAFIKILYKNHKENKQNQRQEQLELRKIEAQEKQNDKISQILDKHFGGKK